VDKPVDGQKDARPPVCPPPAAFPHTHRRNGRFKEKSKIKSEESNLPVGQPFFAAPGRYKKPLKQIKRGNQAMARITAKFVHYHSEFYSLW
jgi:hypothetical protein